MSRSAVTEMDVANAVDVEIRTWRENMKWALEGVQLPQIESRSFLKTCAWLNTAKDPVRVFAPKSQADRVLSWLTSDAVKLAPPMFIASQAASAFDSIYESTIREHNRLLNTRYSAVKDQYFNKIDDRARVFRSTTYGRNIIRQVSSFLAGQTFDDIDKDSYLRLLLNRSRFIETDRQSLRTQAAQGFGKISGLIHTIFLGSYHANRFLDNRKEMRVMTGQRWIGRHGAGENYQRVTSREQQDQILAEAWKYTATHHNSNAFFEAKRADVTELRLRNNPTPLRIPSGWTGPPLSLTQGDRMAREAFRRETGRSLN